MNDDKTEVSTSELDTFRSGMDGRAERVSGVADLTGGFDLGITAFGAINEWFGEGFRETIRSTEGKVRSLAHELGLDAGEVQATSNSFANNDQAQQDRFRGME